MASKLIKKYKFLILQITSFSLNSVEILFVGILLIWTVFVVSLISSSNNLIVHNTC